MLLSASIVNAGQRDVLYEPQSVQHIDVIANHIHLRPLSFTCKRTHHIIILNGNDEHAYC